MKVTAGRTYIFHPVFIDRVTPSHRVSALQRR